MRSLLWFKNDLRLEDNPALLACLDARCLLPVYVIDPALFEPASLGSRKLGVHRTRLLLESLAALDNSLRQHGSRLLIVKAAAADAIPRLVEHLDLQTVVTCEEISPAERAITEAVRQRLGCIPLRETAGNELFHAEELPWPITEAPSTFGAFRAGIAQRPAVFQAKASPNRLPALPENCEHLFESIPSLSQLGVGEPLAAPNSAFPFSGGEAAAHARLRDYFWEGLGLRDYHATRNHLVGTGCSSKLSPWLANGCLSVRRVAADLRRHEAQHGANDSTRALWDALLWREFFRVLMRQRGSALFRHGGLSATQHAPTEVDERFAHWCVGRTGLPLVDACMRELAATGYLSNRGRQVAAAYLVGELQQDWRYGAAWFEEHLLDHEVASNWGNWNCVVGLCCDPLNENPFNAMRMARQFDPDARYVSLWLPELQGLPPSLRHTPFLHQQGGASYPLLSRIPPSWKPYLPTAAA